MLLWHTVNLAINLVSFLFRLPTYTCIARSLATIKPSRLILVIYTTYLLYEMTNLEFFIAVRDAGLKNSNFLIWTGLRQSVSLKLRVHVPNLENIFG